MGGLGLVVLAAAAPDAREPLVRENNANPLDGEQTWPTEEELLDVDKLVKGAARRRRLPEGTSEYQAAWILDDDEEYVDDEDEDGMDADGVGPSSGAGGGGGDNELPPLAAPLADDDDDTMDADADGSDGGGGAVSKEEARRAARQAKLDAERDQEDYPDEVDIPAGVAARTRLQKYRGLKSFRSSPWDVKEWLPREYAKVFAFENGRRAARRAREHQDAATAGEPLGAAVPPGGASPVLVYVAGVPAAAAAAVTARVAAATAAGDGGAAAPPLVAFGLLQHEAKLSVVHFALQKSQKYTEPVRAKEELLLVAGVRAYAARPVFSADNPGDKHKMERFLHDGAHAVASVYAPISYAPLPCLAFKLQPGSPAALVATGTLRGADPDRVVVKKITLTGYPVRVHKRSCTVRFMFHNPDDIRWFRPVELYTKAGRRGRITEPIGTHGAMKCLFDGAVQQNDTVCMSLYKRVFPKWPQDMSFAAG